MEPKRRPQPESDPETAGSPSPRDDAPPAAPEGMTPRRKASASSSDSSPLSAEQLSAAFASLTGSTDPPSSLSGDEAFRETPIVEEEQPARQDVGKAGAQPNAKPSPPGPTEAPPAESGDVTPLGIIEAIFFTGDPGGGTLDSERIASLIRGVEPHEINGFVETLNTMYEEENRPYRIVNQAGGFRMTLHESFHRVRDRFYGRVREARLSQAAVEVLAAVAYNQPTTSEQIRDLRGTSSGAVLNQMVRRKLLRVERTEEKPKKTEYYVTQRFLDLFGLDTINDLPRSEDLNQK